MNVLKVPNEGKMGVLDPSHAHTQQGWKIQYKEGKTKFIYFSNKFNPTHIL